MAESNSPAPDPPASSGSSVFAPPPPYIGPEPDANSKTVAMLCHLLTIVTSFLGPLVVWLMKKDTQPFVNDQGKEALNFALTMLIGFVIAKLLIAVLCIGLLLFPLVGIFQLVFAIIAVMKANTGVAYRYPVCLRFIK
jgi:hypothetical protein